MGGVLGDRRGKRWVAAALAAALVGPALVLAAWPSSAASTFGVSRIGGPDRYDTARQVAEAAFPGGSGTVILANGLNYPDALAGSYLAGTKGIPILLTNPDSLSSAAAQALRELKTKNVTVLGGNLAVTDNVVSQLSSTASTSTAGGNLVPTRLFGATRYETAASIATSGGTIGTISGQPAAIVASGENFPDALAAGPIAVASHVPVLLTNKDHEAPQTEAALQQLGVKQVLLLGGTFAVADAVANSLASSGSRTVTRIAGQDRTDTAAQVYEFALRNFGFSNKSVFLANGTTFPAPDALAGAPLAGKAPTGILLASDADNLGQYTSPEIQSHATTLTSGTILGGALAISAAGQQSFVQAAGGSTNSSGPITLDKTTVAPGDTINGTVANPSTVSSITANGCGNNNQALTVSTAGAFSVVIPASQPGGACSLTFTVVYNNGTATASPSFAITVSNPTLTFHAPTLVSVTVNRSAPPIAFDTAAFKFNEPLASLLPNPANFQLYRASGAFASGVGAPTLNGDAWTISFPPGSATNVTLGGVAPGAVTNTSNQPNFPGSVAASGSGAALVTLEPDLTSVGAPAEDLSNTFFTSTFGFDKSFATVAFPAPNPAVAPSAPAGVTLNSFTTVVPGTTLAGKVTDAAITALTVAGCTISPAQAVTFDASGNFSVTIPAAAAQSSNPNNPLNGNANACTLTFAQTRAGGVTPSTIGLNVGYVYCVPFPLTAPGLLPQDDHWQVTGASGATLFPGPSTAQTATTGGFAAVSTGTIPDTGTCAPASSATAVFGGVAANLGLVAGNVKNKAVFIATNDPVGNPLESTFVPTSTTSSWPVLDRAVESQGSGTSTNVTFFFRTSGGAISDPAGGYVGPHAASNHFQLIKGDGTLVGASSAALVPSTAPSAVVATFPSYPGVANSVGAIARNAGPCKPTDAAGPADTSGCAVLTSPSPTSGFYSDSSTLLFGSGTSSGGQVVQPQLLKVDMTTTASGNTVVYTFDKNLTAALPSFFLYTTDGASTQAGGSPSINANTATFTCSLGLLGLGSACTSFTTATVNAAVAGGAFDAGSNDPSASPPASVQATLNGNLAGTTTTTSTTTTTVP